MTIREGPYAKWATIIGGITLIIAIGTYVFAKPVVINLFGDSQPTSPDAGGKANGDHTDAPATVSPPVQSTAAPVGLGGTTDGGTTKGPDGPAPAVPLPYDNRILVPPGGSSYYVEGGRKHRIEDPEVVNCIAVRRGAGASASVAAAVLAIYADSDAAYCPYELEAGLKFITEQGSGGWVWFVETNGTLRHAASLCVSDPYTTQWKQFRVWQVPTGETAGHKIGSDYYATFAACDTYPKIALS